MIINVLLRILCYPAVLFILLLSVLRFIIVWSYRYFRYGVELLVHKEYDKQTVRELLDLLKSFNDRLNEDSKTALDRETNDRVI